MTVKELQDQISLELFEAENKFPSFHSAHEGYAVLKEEVDELWEEIKKKDASKECMKKEAIQVAAMAMRFILDVVENS